MICSQYLFFRQCSMGSGPVLSFHQSHKRKRHKKNPDAAPNMTIQIQTSLRL